MLHSWAMSLRASKLPRLHNKTALQGGLGTFLQVNPPGECAGVQCPCAVLVPVSPTCWIGYQGCRQALLSQGLPLSINSQFCAKTEIKTPGCWHPETIGLLYRTLLCVGSAGLPAQCQHILKETYLSVLCAKLTYCVFVQLEETTALNHGFEHH